MKILLISATVAIFFSESVQSQLVPNFSPVPSDPPISIDPPVPLDPPSTQEKAVVRGEDAVPGQFPYAAALHYDDQYVCTSSIITSRAVMTAAHCVVLNGVQQDPSLYYATANVKRSADSYRIVFDDVTIHPDYNDVNLNNDVAIFRTSKPIPIDAVSLRNNPLSRICLARSNTGEFEYFNATAIGWGKTSNSDSTDDIPETLQYVKQKIVPNIICGALNTGINENKMCATGFFNGICLGDSGGPLVHLSADKPPVQIGITSYINGLIGCGRLVPAVFTRVSEYTDFIIDVAGNDVCTI